MGCTVAFSVVMAVAIFMILPYFISGFFRDYIVSNTLLAIVEGGIRLGLFVLYVVLISSMKDIKRVYMYHGAEHKCINCIERGRELNVKNVRKSSRYHSRCGTSFLFIVMVISIVFLSLSGWNPRPCGYCSGFSLFRLSPECPMSSSGWQAGARMCW